MSLPCLAGLDRSIGTILGGCAGFGTVWVHYQFIKGPYEGMAYNIWQSIFITNCIQCVNASFLAIEMLTHTSPAGNALLGCLLSLAACVAAYVSVEAGWRIARLDTTPR